MSLRLHLVTIAAAALAGCATAQRPADAEPQGEAPDSVYLLIRSDDAGMTHAVNMAMKRLVETGMAVSVSVMFPTPWWQEAVDILRAHPQVSVGVHITLNSEWKNYRWGPVIGPGAASTLVDDHGYFFHSSRDIYENDPDPAQVEAEIRAQIERAVGTGLQIDYVDFHMGTARNNEGMLEIVRRLAEEYDLLISGFQDETMLDPQYRAAPEDKPDSLAAMVPRLSTRFNVLITHPGLDTPELAALLDMNTGAPLQDMAMHRQGELDALLSEEFAEALDKGAVRLITFRELRALARSER